MAANLKRALVVLWPHYVPCDPIRMKSAWFSVSDISLLQYIVSCIFFSSLSHLLSMSQDYYEKYHHILSRIKSLWYTMSFYRNLQRDCRSSRCWLCPTARHLWCLYSVPFLWWYTNINECQALSNWPSLESGQTDLWLCYKCWMYIRYGNSHIFGAFIIYTSFLKLSW